MDLFFVPDVRSYYASIDQDMLFGMLERYVKDSAVLDSLWSYVYRTIYYEGNYVVNRQEIGLGCPLSPLMGALLLKALDDRLEKTDLLQGSGIKRCAFRRLIVLIWA